MRIKDLPKCMAERALFARNEFISDPNNSQLDDDMIVWCFNLEDGFWYSINGNYSQFSPKEKRLNYLNNERRSKARELKNIRKAEEYYDIVIYHGKIRQAVLDRDNNTCQKCGEKKPSKFHVHHVVKRKENRNDSLDNLITLCPGCHKLLDRPEFQAEWKK